MPDWVELGFDVVAAAQRADMQSKLQEIQTSARIAVESERRTQMENLGRQLVFDLGKSLAQFENHLEKSSEGVYVLLSMAHRILTTLGIGPAYFSQIVDKEHVAEVQENLVTMRKRAAGSLSTTQIEEANRFAQRSFPITELIQAEKRQETIRNAASGMQYLGKKRRFWSLVAILSAIGIFILPGVATMMAFPLAYLDNSGGLFVSAILGLPCLAVAVALTGIVVGLVARSATTPKEWHGLKRIQKEFTKRLPTPQQVAELYKEAGIANDGDYQQAKVEVLAYRNRLNLEGFPELPVVQETLNSLTTESQ